MNEEILFQADAYYTEKIEKFGTTNLGVDWNSSESQEKRFEQLTSLISTDAREVMTICDYGCGYGAYYDYLKKMKYTNFHYTGIDISKKMIEAAEVGHKTENLEFINGSKLVSNYDYIVASGIFNVRQSVSNDDWWSYIIETLKMFNAHAKRGFAFNCLTKYSDKEYMKNYLYYCDPLMLFDFIKNNFSKNVALLHDYDLYEFTILVRLL